MGGAIVDDVELADRTCSDPEEAPSPEPFSEVSVWKRASGEWRPLHGRIAKDGLSVEWHDFKAGKPISWSRSFHPHSLELCLNLSGIGWVESGGRRLRFGAGTMGFYTCGDSPPEAVREAGMGRHQFLTVELNLATLTAFFGGPMPGMDPLVCQALRSGRFGTGVGTTQPLHVGQDRWVKQLLDPPVSQAARGFWLRARVMEILAQCVFNPAEGGLFCDTTKHLARTRVERVVGILRENLAEPPSLAELGRQVGCSQFHLSRTFSKETGSTIQQYLRRLRIERAAELLRSGRMNVTETALEVGYNSLSHFSQAFCHEMGVCPALYQKSGSAS